MALDVQRPDLTIAIVGCGVMGQGIAQIAAQAGCRVLLFDARPGAADAAKTAICGVLAKLVERGLLHRPGQRMGNRMPDEDDALRHAPILSSSPKNPG